MGKYALLLFMILIVFFTYNELFQSQTFSPESIIKNSTQSSGIEKNTHNNKEKKSKISFNVSSHTVENLREDLKNNKRRIAVEKGTTDQDLVLKVDSRLMKLEESVLNQLTIHKKDVRKIKFPDGFVKNDISKLLQLYIFIDRVSEQSQEANQIKSLIRDELIERSQETYNEIIYQFDLIHEYPKVEGQFLDLIMVSIDVSKLEKIEYLKLIFDQQLGNSVRDKFTLLEIRLGLYGMSYIELDWKDRKKLIEIFINRNRFNYDVQMQAKSEIRVVYPDYEFD